MDELKVTVVKKMKENVNKLKMTTIIQAEG